MATGLLFQSAWLDWAVCDFSRKCCWHGGGQELKTVARIPDAS